MKDKKVTLETSIDIENLSKKQFNIIMSALNEYLNLMLQQARIHSNDNKKLAVKEKQEEARIAKEFYEIIMKEVKKIDDLVSTLESEENSK